MRSGAATCRGLAAGLLLAVLAGPAAIAQSTCEEHLTQARQYFDMRNAVAAVAAFESALAVCADKNAVLLPLAQMQYLHGDEAGAERNLKLVLAADASNAAARYALGRIYYQQNRFPDAEAQFQEVVKRDAKHYRAWDNLGLVYDALRSDGAALKAYFRALDLVKDEHRDYEWPYANLADFFLRRDQPEKAFQLAAEAAHRNPASARNAFLTGKALVKLQKEDLSERWLKRAVELDSAYAEAHYLLAQYYRRRHRAEDAARHLAAFKQANENPRSRR